MSIGEFFKKFWGDERGQSTTEYILILAVVVMLATKFRTAFSSRLGGIIDKLGTEIDGATTSSP